MKKLLAVLIAVVSMAFVACQKPVERLVHRNDRGYVIYSVEGKTTFRVNAWVGAKPQPFGGHFAEMELSREVATLEEARKTAISLFEEYDNAKKEIAASAPSK